MRKYSFVLASVALAGLVAVPATASTDSNESAETASGCARQFDDAVRSFDDAFLAKRLDAFVAYYHQHATTIGASGSVTTTKDEIRANFAGLFDYEFTATFPTISKRVEGCKTAVIVSDFNLAIPELEYTSHFINSLTWIREHGRWQVLNDQNTPVL
jgi:ketosteroid isomerase-like protein